MKDQIDGYTQQMLKIKKIQGGRAEFVAALENQTGFMDKYYLLQKSEQHLR